MAERVWRGILEGAVLWEGDVLLEEDVLVPAGARLRVAPGCLVRAELARETEGLLVERLAFGSRALLNRPRRRHLWVEGSLEVQGEAGAPVQFDGPGWAGIFLLGRGRALMRRAVLESAGGFGLTCVDFSRASLEDCELRGAEGGAACGGFSRVKLKGCRLTGGARAGLWAQDDAEARASSCRFEGGEIGLLAEGAARVCEVASLVQGQRLAGAAVRGGAGFKAWRSSWLDNGTGVTAQGRSSCALTQVRTHGNGIALWAQNSSRVRIAGGRWESNRVGLKASHHARVLARRAAFESQDLSGVFAEDSSSVELEACAFAGNRNGALVLHRARLGARACRFSDCGDTAVWRDHRSRVSLSGVAFAGNKVDSHCERQPSYA